MSYREVAFYFYTGTGNSYRVAAWMADAARDAGSAVVLHPIASALPDAEIGTGEQDLLGLVMPTHGFTAPWAAIRFALRLPRRRRTHAVVVATRGGYRIGSLYTPGFEGSATALAALILALKGYRIRGAVGIDMPSNWIAVHPALPPDAVVEIIARARIKSASFVGAVLAGKRRIAGWVLFLLGLLVLPISLAYLLIGRLFLSKLFFASGLCTGCGLCAEHCPNGAISMPGPGRRRPFWTFRCQSCMRCMAYCPAQAVEVSYLWAVAIYVLAHGLPITALLIWLTTLVPALTFLRGTPLWLLESVLGIAVLGAAYPLLHFLLGNRRANRFFTLTTPTHYYRRYREPQTTLEDLKH